MAVYSPSTRWGGGVYHRTTVNPFIHRNRRVLKSNLEYIQGYCIITVSNKSCYGWKAQSLPTLTAIGNRLPSLKLSPALVNAMR